MNNNSRGPYENLMKDAEFQEELLLLKAQELVSELMQKRGVSKTDLAKKLKTSKAYITGLLSDGRNLTLRTLARVCYHLGSEVSFEAKGLGLSESGNYQLETDLPPNVGGTIETLTENDMGMAA